MSEERLSVFVVDDDVSVREALKPLLDREGWDARTYNSANAFLVDHAVTGPSCLILDVGLPDLNGLDVQALVADEGSALPIIFITGYGDIPTSVRAMKAGAAEFLTKPFDDVTLVSAVRTALDRSRAAFHEKESLQLLKSRYATLSTREREVFALVVAGLLNKQIAYELGISEITVKAHRGRAVQKMGAKSFAELVNMGTSLGLRQALQT
jgi:FixJ family two-component response regulator